MVFIPIALLGIGGIVVFKLIMRGEDPNAPPIGPQGRWWVGPLIALAVAFAGCAVVIWGYLTFLQQN